MLESFAPTSEFDRFSRKLAFVTSGSNEEPDLHTRFFGLHVGRDWGHSQQFDGRLYRALNLTLPLKLIGIVVGQAIVLEEYAQTALCIFARFNLTSKTSLFQHSVTCHREERSDLNSQPQNLLVIHNKYHIERDSPFSIAVVKITGRGEAFSTNVLEMAEDLSRKAV